MSRPIKGSAAQSSTAAHPECSALGSGRFPFMNSPLAVGWAYPKDSSRMCDEGGLEGGSGVG
jgi:hypothetical protein